MCFKTKVRFYIWFALVTHNEEDATARTLENFEDQNVSVEDFTGKLKIS